MASDEHIELEEEENNKENKGKKVAKHDDGAADLEKVTDHVDEVEISAQSIGDVSVKFQSPFIVSMSLYSEAVHEERLQ